jgi:hypothetical protein
VWDELLLSVSEVTFLNYSCTSLGAEEEAGKSSVGMLKCVLLFALQVLRIFNRLLNFFLKITRQFSSSLVL